MPYLLHIPLLFLIFALISFSMRFMFIGIYTVLEFCLKCDPKSATRKGTWTSLTSIFAFYVLPSLLMFPNSIKLLSLYL